MRLSNELQIGKAGEYLVCADLISKGFVAFPSEQGLPYDVLLDNGKRLLRVQVKTCEKPRKLLQRSQEYSVYQYNIRAHGKHSKRFYDADEVDLFAIVALDTKQVGYLLRGDAKKTINIRVDRLRGSYYDERVMQTFLDIREMYKTEKNQHEISRNLGINLSTVRRMIQDDYKPYKAPSKYFSDFDRGSEWFTDL